MRLLIVEDEEELRSGLVEGLRMDGYEVDECDDGNKALQQILSESYDLVLLDLNLPGMDGMEVLRRMRLEDEKTNVLILSARSTLVDKVEGLDCGANDYLCKPFHFEELEARVRSLTRRVTIQNNVVLTCGRIRLDTQARMAYVKEKQLNLTRKELGILEYLMLHQSRLVSAEELLSHVWDSNADPFSNSIRVHISGLRKKLRAQLGTDPIENHIGQGYTLKEIA